MTKLNSFKDLSKADYNKFCREIEAGLAAVAEKYGVKFKAGNGRFSGGSMDIKLNASVVSADGSVQTKEASDYLLLGRYQGLKPEWLGKRFQSNGKVFQISGYRSRAPKKPVLAECLSDGKQYIFPADIVVLRMNASVK